VRRPFEDPLAFLLRHAAKHAEDFALAVLLELLETMEDFLFALSRMLHVL